MTCCQSPRRCRPRQQMAPTPRAVRRQSRRRIGQHRAGAFGMHLDPAVVLPVKDGQRRSWPKRLGVGPLDDYLTVRHTLRTPPVIQKRSTAAPWPTIRVATRTDDAARISCIDIETSFRFAEWTTLRPLHDPSLHAARDAQASSGVGRRWRLMAHRCAMLSTP